MPQDETEYGEFIYQYFAVPEETRLRLEAEGLAYNLGKQYTILCLPIPRSRPLRLVEEFGYFVVPKVYGLLDAGSMEASGITAVQNQPVLQQRGAGVLIGILDTGIDYTLDIFRNADGTTRITSIWDQTLENGREKKRRGRVFDREDINRALQSENPLEIVPTTDDNGHGTFLASIAAGYRQDGTYTGAALDAQLAVVKLRQAPAHLREYFFIPQDVWAASEADLLMAVEYLLQEAARLSMPLVLLVAVGTSQGNHRGSDPLSAYLQWNAFQRGVAIVTSAGNESGRGHHFLGNIAGGQPYEEVEIQVTEGEPGFSLELWARAPETFFVNILSPIYGEASSIQVTGTGSTVRRFVLDGTTVFVDYHLVESVAGGQLILMRFETPSAGVWRIRVTNDLYIGGQYQLWLPITGFIGPETRFLRPNPDMTIVAPGNGQQVMTIGAYQYQTGAIWNYSSRGFSGNGAVKPDMVAPGADVGGIGPGGRPEVRSGTSVAAAHVAGASALLLSWGLIEGNQDWMNTTTVATYLIRGANRKSTLQYPNPEWGYGSLNLYQTFLNL